MVQSACSKNDKWLREVVMDDSVSLSEISRRIGTNRTRVKQYLEKHSIPHRDFVWSNIGEKNGRWTGGRIVDEDGYILVKSFGHPYADRHDYVREHRLVMEKKLGRYLLPSEVVHHLDDNKNNNSPENLELFSRNSDHLAATLKGKVPNWTPDGVRRILEGVRKSRGHRQISSQK